MRSRQHESRRFKVLDKLELWARFWTMWVSLALFDRLPEGGDDPQCFLTTLGVCGLDEPASNDHAGPANPPAAMYRANPTSPFIVPQDVQDGKHELR